MRLKSEYRNLVKFFREFAVTPWNVDHVHGPAKPDLGPDDVVVLCPCRDEEEIIEAFLEHHRAIGARHFVFLDNGSVDGTRDIIAKQNDCTLLLSRLPFSVFWVYHNRYLVRRFGRRNWCLMLDADEFFDYPFSGQIPLGSLVRYLDRHRYDAVTCTMLDMYARGNPGLDSAGRFSRAMYPCFELTSLKTREITSNFLKNNRITNPLIRWYGSGVRGRVFGTDGFLTKHPLVRYRGIKNPWLNNHLVRGCRIADFSCVLYHYKLRGAFTRKALQYAVEENHFMDSTEYKKYRDGLLAGPVPDLATRDTLALEGSTDLVGLGLMAVSEQYLSDLTPGGIPSGESSPRPARSPTSRSPV